MQIVELKLLAPIPVGHRVTILPLEMYMTPLFGGAASWRALSMHLVCDETTRVIYADRSVGLHPETTYEQIRFERAETRVSQSEPPIRGVVTACVVLSDSGDTISLQTILHVDSGAQLG